MDFNRLDVSAKELVWEGPDAWFERFAIGPRGPVTVIDSDITTLTAADKMLRVDGPEPYLVNIEPHSYHDTKLARTLWYRQVALDYRHNLPVLTVLVLLCKEANSPSLTGSYERQLPDGWPTNRYNYRVVQLWQEDPDPYLASGVNLVPLAPLTNVAEESLPDLMRQMAERINPEPRAAGGEALDRRAVPDGAALRVGVRQPVSERSVQHAGIDDVSGHRERGPRRRGAAAPPPTGRDSFRASRRGNPSCHRGDRRSRSPGADERPDRRHEHPRLEWPPGHAVSHEAAAASGEARDRDVPAHAAECCGRSDGSCALLEGR